MDPIRSSWEAPEGSSGSISSPRLHRQALSNYHTLLKSLAVCFHSAENKLLTAFSMGIITQFRAGQARKGANWDVLRDTLPAFSLAMCSELFVHDQVLPSKLPHHRTLVFYNLENANTYTSRGLPRWPMQKMQRCRFNPWVRKISCSRKRHPIPVYLPEKFYG